MDDKLSFWSRVKFLVIAGVGLYSDGYLNLAIGLGALLSTFYHQLHC